MPIRRGTRFKDLWTKLLANIDARIAVVEPVAMELLGSKEQRLARIELAFLQASRESAIRGIKRSEALKPTK
jgi:hypothetical protein